MLKKRIVIMGSAVDSELVYFCRDNTSCREGVKFILLNELSRINREELKICEKADLILVFLDSYDEAKILYGNFGYEIKNKCVCLLEKMKNENNGDSDFEPKIIQWIYQKEMKAVVLEMLMKMFSEKSIIVSTELASILRISKEAPELKSEIMVHKGKKEDVFGEIECCVARNVNMICSFFSFEGSLTLNDVSNLYEICKKKSGPEYILFNSDSEEYKVLALWQKMEGEE